MDTVFITIVQKLISEKGKDTLFNTAKCKGALADYVKGEYKKESRLLIQAVEAGTAKLIDSTQELQICKKQQIQHLQDEYFLAEVMAAEVVDMLAFVLRADTSKTTSFPNVSSGQAKTIQHSDNKGSLYKLSFNFKESGPFDLQQLKTMIQNGQISSEYWVCQNGTDSWFALRQVPELQDFLKNIILVGDTGPAGGYIFYDKGNYSDGWRYLELSPPEAEFRSVWASSNIDTYNLVDGISTEIGTGKKNTKLMMEVDKKETYEKRHIIKSLCTRFKNKIYNDWFIPSKDEFSLCADRKILGLNDFAFRVYWSSSDFGNNDAWHYGFYRKDYWDDDGWSAGYKNTENNIRPIRSF
ncbi:MAG: DUF4339 domain-containing protein [Spirochaetaceae bacterium]|jgi:hypothetical protein|nr:DUF4339 domain-containing protein [Spirochaetaceae bacterium]